ncbi:hypothetical protein GE061_010030 [Apolygus lucorum]|uniref:Protein kinase domain-containing protein n=1 Tax=Apolygus lucorum TaxID=248454 RepID=A0A8S9Y3Y6_APOLU|nr:hypothetical protein GE061_010030 [Apolygus lucorum]
MTAGMVSYMAWVSHTAPAPCYSLPPPQPPPPAIIFSGSENAGGTGGGERRVSSTRNRGSDEPHIGKYRLLKTIGKGNFAKVKLAKHVPTGKEQSPSTDKQLVRQLNCNFQSLGYFSSPNVSLMNYPIYTLAKVVM